MISNETLRKRIEKALEIAPYGAIDGAHHKMWVIDQMVRALLGSEEAYKAWTHEMLGEYDEENEEYEYEEWDEGIAP